MNESKDKELTKEKFDLLVAEFNCSVSDIRFKVGGVDSEDSCPRKKAVECEPDLFRVKILSEAILSSRFADPFIAKEVRVAVDDLEEEFDEIKRGCSIEA